METIPFFTKRPVSSCWAYIYVCVYIYIYVYIKNVCIYIYRNKYKDVVSAYVLSPLLKKHGPLVLVEHPPLNPCPLPSVGPFHQRSRRRNEALKMWFQMVPHGSKWPWGHSKYVAWELKCPSLNHPCLYKMAVDASSCSKVSKPVSTWNHLMKTIQTCTTVP